LVVVRRFCTGFWDNFTNYPEVNQPSVAQCLTFFASDQETAEWRAGMKNQGGASAQSIAKWLTLRVKPSSPGCRRRNLCGRIGAGHWQKSGERSSFPRITMAKFGL
jgi:hypothetical protein